MNKVEISVENTDSLVWTTWKKLFNKAWQKAYDKVVNPDEAEVMKRNFDDDRKQAFEKAKQLAA